MAGVKSPVPSRECQISSPSCVCVAGTPGNPQQERKREGEEERGGDEKDAVGGGQVGYTKFVVLSRMGFSELPILQKAVSVSILAWTDLTLHSRQL